MTAYYIDSSALVKRYIEERGSELVHAVVDDPDAVCYVSLVAGAEVVATLTRRGRGATWTDERVDQLVGMFRGDLASRYRVLEGWGGILLAAMSIARRYGLRGYDAVHLASCLDANTVQVEAGADAVTMVSAADDLNAAAQAEGLAVLNPVGPPDATLR